MNSFRKVTEPAKEAPLAMRESGIEGVAQYVKHPAMIAISTELKMMRAALTEII